MQMRRPVQWVCLAAVSLGACAHPAKAGHAEGMHHRFDDPEKWAKVFEDPERDSWQRPDEVLAALALDESASAADLGSATGYFAVRLAKKLTRGRVYGVDIEPAMVAFLADRARKEGLANLESVLGTESGANLPALVDMVLVVDTYHHVDRRPDYFRRLGKDLRPGGRVAIVDFRKGQPLGPPDEFKVDPEVVVSEMAQGGFVLLARHDFLPAQHFLVFGLAP